MKKIDLLKEKVKKDLMVNIRCLKEQTKPEMIQILELWKDYDRQLLEILDMDEKE